MLVFLVTGGVVASRSPFFEPISSAMEVYAKPAYVAFFVLSGWHLDFKVLAASWVAVAVYAGARIIGRVLGARVGVAAAGKPMEGVGRQLGLGLLCQAGAAIALAHLTSRYDPELGARLLNIILGAVVLFEIAGPLLVRRIVVAAGEVRVAQLLVRSVPRFQTPWLRALRRMLRGRMRLGRRDIESLTVGDLTRRNHTPLPAGADMDEILHYANRSSLQRFPVVGEDGRLRGLIQLQDLSDAVYDPQAAPLVIADDLTTVRPESVSLPADASLREAADFFGRYDANHAPVVDDKESLQYRGVVERAEVLRLVRDLRRRNEEDAA
jgi:CBS domain-containing protein